MSSAPRPAADVEAEQEFDFRRYGNAVLARLWLPLAGIAVGLVLGYLSTLGGHTVYQAQAVVYLGQPLSPSGAPLQTLATNPNTAREIVRSASAIRSAARISGLPFANLENHVSVKAVANTQTKKSASGQTPLVRVSVTGRAPRKVALAANALAARVVHSVSGYPDLKIQTLTSQLAGEDAALASLNARARALRAALRAPSSSPLERLLLVSQEDVSQQRSAALLEQRTNTQQLLALAKLVERSRVVSRASAVNSTARSTRSALLVGALIGLIVGLVLALLWDPVATRLRR